MRSIGSLCALALLACCTIAAPTPSWHLVRNAHFEIYTQSSSPNVNSALLWFEQLRAFFARSGIALDGRPPVRIILFASLKEYDSYRLHQSADAFYVGTDSRDYIVMPALDPGRFGMAAHEYAHLLLHAAGLHLPPWLNEGLAEFFSTVRISNSRCELGGDVRARSQLLRSRSWLPLSLLLSTPPEMAANRSQSGLFYAQSWALAEMLLAAPEYRAHFPALLAAFTSGEGSAAALTGVYGKSLDAIAKDLRARLNSGAAEPVSAPGLSVGSVPAASSELSPFAARSMLAEVLLASGELGRAEALYLDLARESPRNSEVSAALGAIALRRGDLKDARAQWKQAIAQGITDADLCYRYAVLADEAGDEPQQVRAALERAIELHPAFDDARFKLALLANNDADYRTALAQLEAMKPVSETRAFGYWIAMAYAQDQLALHDDSKRSAQKALQFAATERERNEATELGYVADTQLTVQFARDAQGKPQVTTTRVPRGTLTWNPFIEPQDQMRRAQGQLRNIECGSNDKITAVDVDTANGFLKLAIPDPQHVLIRGVNEFTCGPQPARAVTVEYAASQNKAHGEGILRGMEVLTK